MPRQHQSSTSSTSGKEGGLLRARRSVDEHASLSSVSATDSSTVDMHEIITSSFVTTGSLVHGVSSEVSTESQDAASKASVLSATGDLGLNVNVTNTTTLLHIITKTENTSTNEKYKVTNKPVMLEKPSEFKDSKRDKIAYDPEEMQADAFPSIYSYGVQKLQYLKLLTRLNEVNEELHIFSNNTEEVNENLDKYHYDNSAPKNSYTSPAPVFATTVNNTTLLLMNDKKITETNIFTTPDPNPDVTLTSTPQSAPSISVNNTEPPSTTSSTETSTNNDAADSKTPDVPANTKHVLINLTISSDDADYSYKPLYSLTFTVPTVGDTNEIPTVKITPMDLDPTAPTNFNKPVIIDNTKTSKETTKTEDWGGSCECSCPVCESSISSEDFFDDGIDKTTPASTDRPISSTDSIEKDYITTDTPYHKTTETYYSTEEDSPDNITTGSTKDETLTTTDLVNTSTDELTVHETSSTSEVPSLCVCPKVKPPPILVLEGEVFKIASY